MSPARATDPVTSHAAAAKIRLQKGNQRHLLLSAYLEGEALSDAQAATRVGLMGTRSCWWKRCSELREGGYLEVVGTVHDDTTDADVQVCRITDTGQRGMRLAG